MKLVFKNMKLKNFFSIGNKEIEIDFTKHKTTFVCGKNGSGKSSTILDGIHFVLYGKPFRNVNIPNVVNSINKKECITELCFTAGDKDVVVRRGLKPKVFEIFVNGKFIDQDASVKDYQKYLENVICGGMNEKVFKQIIVIGSAEYKPFMQLTTSERREVIEQFLDIGVFSTMNELAKEKISNIKENIKVIENNIILVEEKIKIHADNEKKLHEDNAVKREQLETLISKEMAAIEHMQEQIKKSDESKQKIIDALSSTNEIMQLKKEIEKSILETENKIELSEENILFFNSNEHCPTCKQTMSDKYRHDCLTTHKKDLEKFLSDKEKTEDKFKKCLAAVEKIDVLNGKLSALDKNIFKYQTEITSKNKLIQNCMSQIKTINKSDNKKNYDIKSLEHEILNYKQDLNIELEDRNYYEIAVNLLKDGGIKTKIIRQYIPLINKLINSYLDKFGLPAEFTLDEMFNEVVKSRYRDTFQYNNFSEGEKQRIDLSILMAWREITKMKNTINTNLLIFDEVFDKSLDDNATETLLDILLEMDKGQNIFVISHKNSLNNKLDNVIKFEKVKNFTKIIDGKTNNR